MFGCSFVRLWFFSALTFLGGSCVCLGVRVFVCACVVLGLVFDLVVRLLFVRIGCN